MYFQILGVIMFLAEPRSNGYVCEPSTSHMQSLPTACPLTQKELATGPALSTSVEVSVTTYGPWNGIVPHQFFHVPIASIQHHRGLHAGMLGYQHSRLDLIGQEEGFSVVHGVLGRVPWVEGVEGR